MNRRPHGGPDAVVQTTLSQSTASRRLPHGWDYLVLIQGTDGFSVIFDGRGEPKAAILAAVYGKAFQERLKTTALHLGQSLYVEVLGYHTGTLKDLPTLALRHEGPAVLVMQATYDEGALMRSLTRSLAVSA